MKILVFGSCNIDHVYSLDHIFAPGETISADAYNVFPGGKGLNQAIATAKADCPVFFAGCIGRDGLFLRDMLDNSGVNTEYLKITDLSTGHAIIQVDRNGQNSIMIFSGSNGNITEEYIDSVLSHFSSGDIILLQNEINNLDLIISKANAMGMKIILNPSPFRDSFRKYDFDSFFCIILNETEAAQWCGSTDGFLEMIKNKKADAVLTLGGDGCVYCHNGEIKKYPSYRTEVVDTTAAGDTFTGYFISGLYNGNSIDDTIKTASAAAAIAISKEGASSSIPSMETVREQIGSMTSNI